MPGGADVSTSHPTARVLRCNDQHRSIETNTRLLGSVHIIPCPRRRPSWDTSRRPRWLECDPWLWIAESQKEDSADQNTFVQGRGELAACEKVRAPLATSKIRDLRLLVESNSQLRDSALHNLLESTNSMLDQQTSRNKTLELQNGKAQADLEEQMDGAQRSGESVIVPLSSPSD